jgi:hypothetical protein
LPGRGGATMLPFEQRLVEDVIDRLTLLQGRSPDSVDGAEVILEVQEEFGMEAVRWGFRFFLARGAAERRRLAAAARGPLWDRDLDGGP